MIERVGFHPDLASDKREHYYRSHGTTFNALRKYHGVDARDFFSFVHDIPLERHLAPEPELDGMLERLPFEKVVFTNSDGAHVERVLNRLGICRHFSRIIDIFALDLVNKPDLRAYTRALCLISARPQECVFVEDSPANLLPARELGMTTVLVGGDIKPAGVDFQIPRITLLEKLFTK